MNILTNPAPTHNAACITDISPKRKTSLTLGISSASVRNVIVLPVTQSSGVFLARKTENRERGHERFVKIIPILEMTIVVNAIALADCSLVALNAQEYIPRTTISSLSP